MNRFELLAPAGSYDAFLAAVENGADAVYLGGKLFNARANANNFELEELKEMVEYAHLRDVKIHVTLNTLVNNNEINEALDFAYDLYNIGVDAVIVQDLGLAKVLHENIPLLPLHASTQMSVYNLAGVEELKKLGFSRVVLARELSFDEIKHICDNTDMEIEIFIHGAQCVCYSGQCLMSSMIGDRSGNRGKCAQPCRMKYDLVKYSSDNTVVASSVSTIVAHRVHHNKEEICESGYLLSPKDLCTLEDIINLPNVASLKIEGRMKSPEYVATVVSSYRKVLDDLCSGEQCSPSIAPETLKQDLLQVFNRGGFTDGYHHRKPGKDMMCYEKSKHWGIYIGKVTNYDDKRYIQVDNVESLHIGDGIEIWNGENDSPSTIVSELTNNKVGRITGNIHIGDKVYKTYNKALMQNAKESYTRGFVKKRLVDVQVNISLDNPIDVQIGDYSYHSDIVPEVPKKAPISEDTIIEQFRKTGNTPFGIANLQVNMNNEVFLPISKINELRRLAFRYYEEFLLDSLKRKQVLKKPLIIPKAQSSVCVPKSISLSVHFLNKDLSLIAPKIDNLYIPLKEAVTKNDLLKYIECKKYIVLPTITKDTYNQLLEKHFENIMASCNGFVVSHIGQLQYFKNAFDEHPYWRNMLAPELIANYTWNIFNSYTIDQLKDFEFNKVILSPELTNAQINTLSSSLLTEVLVYGKQCVMTSEYCPIGSIVGGFSKKQKCSMPCTKNDTYYLRDRMGLDFRIIPDNIACQSQIYNCKTTSISSKDLLCDSILINVIDEDIKEISHIIDVHQAGEKLSGEVYTNAHATRPV